LVWRWSMSEDAIGHALGAHVVASEPAAELWHRVALGELSPDEAVARLLEGRDVSEEERAEIERARVVFAPPTPERRQAALEELLARRETGGKTVVVPMRPQRTRRWVVGLLAAAAAVVLTVWLVPPRGGDGEAFTGAYTIDLEKAAVTVRGAGPQADVPTFLLDGKIAIRLVPEEAVEGPVGVVAYVWDRSGQAERLELEPTVHRSGVMELETTVRALGLDEGEWELVIAIGWTEALPSSWEEIARAEADGTAGFEVVRKRLRVVARLSEGESDG
jgi:hypothetical protein